MLGVHVCGQRTMLPSADGDRSQHRKCAGGGWLGRVVPIVADDKDKCTRIESDSQMCRHPTGIQITLEQRVAIARCKTDVR